MKDEVHWSNKRQESHMYSFRGKQAPVKAEFNRTNKRQDHLKNFRGGAGIRGGGSKSRAGINDSYTQQEQWASGKPRV
eukprot:scaffold33750_cov12-Tisochrysis_lutea.AAC.1